MHVISSNPTTERCRILVNPIDVWRTCLIWVGLISAAIYVCAVTASLVNSTTDEFGQHVVVKTSLYYVSHAVQIVSLVSAGFLALRAQWFRIRGTRHFTLFLLFLVVVAVMVLRGYTLGDLLSKRLVSAYGPFPFLISVLIYVSAYRNDWRFHKRVFVLVGCFSTLMVLFTIARLPTTTRDQVANYLWAYMQVQLWVAAWFVLIPPFRQKVFNWLRWIPFAVYVIASIFGQVRSRFLYTAFILFAYLYLANRRGEQPLVLVYKLVILAILLILVALPFVMDTDFEKKLLESGRALHNRLYEDTRSRQFVDFFDQVPPTELILGRGALAAWDWGNDRIGRSSLDCGYLEFLFRGGIPLLITYVVFHFWPMVRVLRSNAVGLELTCAMLVMLWAAKLLMSSCPTLSLDYYLVLFCVGGCLGRIKTNAIRDSNPATPLRKLIPSPFGANHP